MSDLEKFSRCKGCPEIPEGSICPGLRAAVVELGVSDPNFKEVELCCKKLDPFQNPVVSRIVITKDGAIYPTGVAFNDATRAFFGR